MTTRSGAAWRSIPDAQLRQDHQQQERQQAEAQAGQEQPMADADVAALAEVDRQHQHRAQREDDPRHPRVETVAPEDGGGFEVPAAGLALGRRRHALRGLHPAAHAAGQEAEEIAGPVVVQQDEADAEQQDGEQTGQEVKRQPSRRPAPAGQVALGRFLFQRGHGGVVAEQPRQQHLDEEQAEHEQQQPVGDPGADRRVLDDDGGAGGVRHLMEVGDDLEVPVWEGGLEVVGRGAAEVAGAALLIGVEGRRVDGDEMVHPGP